MQDGTSSYQEVFQAQSFKIWVLWNFTSEDTLGFWLVLGLLNVVLVAGDDGWEIYKLWWSLNFLGDITIPLLV